MPLSGTAVRAALAAVAAVGKQIKSFDELAAGANDALRQAPAGLTPAGAAAFMATAAVESAWFRTTTEYGSGQRYAPFVGRTFVQLTWKENYAGFGKWCKAKGLVTDADVFVKNPGSLSDFRWAWLGAVYYFEAHGIWRWANAGDFRAVSQAVNGGNGRVGTSFVPNGWKERQAMYAVFLGVGGGLLPSGAAPAPAPRPASSARPTLQEGATGDLVVAVQRWLNATFPAYSKIDLGPKRYGPQTVAVIKEFQRRAGVTGSDADGTIIGPRTWAAFAQQGFRG
jgi:hypothetical protein